MAGSGSDEKRVTTAMPAMSATIIGREVFPTTFDGRLQQPTLVTLCILLTMSRKFFKRHLPKPEVVRGHASLRFLGDLLHEPNLWHLNRRSVSRAVFIGIFCAFIPLPLQMLFAALLSLWIRSNLALSVGLVWITNPLTIPPIFYSTYKLGCVILDVPQADFDIELSWQWLTESMKFFIAPLLVGSLTAGTILASISYFAMTLFWRQNAMKRWKNRRANRSK